MGYGPQMKDRVTVDKSSPAVIFDKKHNWVHVGSEGQGYAEMNDSTEGCLSFGWQILLLLLK